MQTLPAGLQTVLGLSNEELNDSSLNGSLRLIERLEALSTQVQALLNGERRFLLIAYGNVKPYSASELGNSPNAS